MTGSGDKSESGITVYPRLPMPAMPAMPDGRRGEPRQPPRRKPTDRRLIAVGIAAVLAGGASAWFLRPRIAPDARIAAAAKRADDAEKAARVQKDRADALEKSLDTTAKAKRDAEAKLTVAEAAQSELAGKTAAETDQRKAAQAIQAKLRAAIDKSVGAVTLDGADVHLLIADRVLWKPNDDALTDRGKAVLHKVGAALKDLPDKLVWVQGHTDEQPRPGGAGPEIPREAPKPPAASPAKKSGKPAAAASPPAPMVRFPTSWELSAARALSVVRYFQDVAKLDPTRLTALAFGQYAPVSKADRSANRRLEIVVATRRPPTR